MKKLLLNLLRVGTVTLLLLTSPLTAPKPPPKYLITYKDKQCLADNIYYEARGESYKGKLAVVLVTLNRSRDYRWPQTVCEVVYQKNQFSWTKTKRKHTKITQEVMALIKEAESTNFSAFYYHNIHVKPKWKLTRIAKIDNHIFYR